MHSRIFRNDFRKSPFYVLMLYFKMALNLMGPKNVNYLLFCKKSVSLGREKEASIIICCPRVDGLSLFLSNLIIHFKRSETGL